MARDRNARHQVNGRFARRTGRHLWLASKPVKLGVGPRGQVARARQVRARANHRRNAGRIRGRSRAAGIRGPGPDVGRSAPVTWSTRQLVHKRTPDHGYSGIRPGIDLGCSSRRRLTGCCSRRTRSSEATDVESYVYHQDAGLWLSRRAIDAAGRRRKEANVRKQFVVSGDALLADDLFDFIREVIIFQ